EGLIRFRTGELHLHYLSKIWIEHLAMNASGHLLSTQVFGLQANQVQGIEFEALPQEQAHQILADLIQHYVQGMDKPLAIFPKTMQAALDQGFDKSGLWHQDNVDFEMLQDKMQKAFVGDDYYAEGESNNSYIQRVWPHWSEALCQQVIHESCPVFIPLYQSIKRLVKEDVA
ncbi:MAG: hypothetical protein ACPHV3_01330, partial [Vibrio sp.]